MLKCFSWAAAIGLKFWSGLKLDPAVGWLYLHRLYLGPIYFLVNSLLLLFCTSTLSLLSLKFQTVRLGFWCSSSYSKVFLDRLLYDRVYDLVVQQSVSVYFGFVVDSTDI